MIAGCNETHARKKQAMIQKWEKSTASAQLPVIEQLIKQGQLEKAKKQLSDCIEGDPELAGAYVLIGRVHYLESRNELAKEAFLKSLELNPKLDQAWYYLGSLAVLEKDYTQAAEDYQNALELMPSSGDYILCLSNVYAEMEQFDRAEEVLEEGLSRQPQNLHLLLSKGQLEQRRGRIVEAIRIYEQAELMHGEIPQVLEPSGYAYIAQKQWAAAADKFSLLLDQYEAGDERYNVTMRSLALCLYNSENYGEALYWYDKLSVIYRDDADIWLNMAQAALNMEDAKRAAYCAINALKINPSWAEAYAVLGSARYIQGLYEQSLQAFYKISNDDSLGAFAWFMSGRCYQQLGQNRQANAAFERAEELDPNNELIASFLKKTIHPL